MIRGANDEAYSAAEISEERRFAVAAVGINVSTLNRWARPVSTGRFCSVFLTGDWRVALLTLASSRQRS